MFFPQQKSIRMVLQCIHPFGNDFSMLNLNLTSNSKHFIGHSAKKYRMGKRFLFFGGCFFSYLQQKYTAEKQKDGMFWYLIANSGKRMTKLFEKEKNNLTKLIKNYRL